MAKDNQQIVQKNKSKKIENSSKSELNVQVKTKDVSLLEQSIGSSFSFNSIVADNSTRNNFDYFLGGYINYSIRLFFIPLKYVRNHFYLLFESGYEYYKLNYILSEVNKISFAFLPIDVSVKYFFYQVNQFSFFTSLGFGLGVSFLFHKYGVLFGPNIYYPFLLGVKYKFNHVLAVQLSFFYRHFFDTESYMLSLGSKISFQYFL